MPERPKESKQPGEREPQVESTAGRRASTPETPASPGASEGRGNALGSTLRRIPVPVLAAAVALGFVAVALAVAAIQMLTKNPPAAPVPSVDTSSAAPAAPDLQWRSGRMDKDDCIGSFEVTRGAATRAGLIAFVMDSSGAVIARDSTQVASTLPGLLVEFRFRHVGCDAIRDWQLQVMTPRPH